MSKLKQVATLFYWVTAFGLALAPMLTATPAWATYIDPTGGQPSDIGPVCSPAVDLISNGSFEVPVVDNDSNWDIFPSDPNNDLGSNLWWGAEWVAPGEGAPNFANLELQKAPLNGWSAQAGDQWAELDTDYDGPGGSIGGEAASIRLTQNIKNTKGGCYYNLEFYTLPRPGYGPEDNTIEVSWNGVVIDTITTDGSSLTQPDWAYHQYTVQADDLTADLSFTDIGIPNSFGMLLDNVQIHCIEEKTTIVAHKIVCDSEEDLPNWGIGGEPITATTAQDFVTSRQGRCHFQAGWQFQWAPEGTSNPGDTMIGEAGGWNTLPATDGDGKTTITLTATDIAGSSYLWFREALLENYVPFSSWLSDGSNTPSADDEFSAEVYATTDVLNYDNYDRIEDVENGGIKLGQTYYAVAFNVLAEPEEDPCDFGEQTGWFGQYYDYTANHQDMNLPTGVWPDKTHGDPLSKTATWTADWYDSDYFVRSQVDPSLNFGNDFFPLDSPVLVEDPAGSGHNYHFGAHWSGKVTVGTEGDYNFALKSDDDAWVYLDGELIKDNSGIHQPQENNGSAHMTVGTHIVDIFFAERHTVQSYMAFAFENQDLLIVPYNDECPVPVPTLSIDKTGVYDQAGQIDYTITWSVEGEGTLHNVTITDAIPAGTTYVPSDPSGIPAAGVVTWILGDKTAPDSGTIHLIVSIDSYEPWADSHSDFTQGLRKDNTPVVEERSHPDKALGVAENNDTINFVSLGFGGSLVLHFNNYILDGAGADIAVTETSYGEPSDTNYPEKVEVFASQTGNGTDWVSLGRGIQDQDFDLNGSGLAWARYLKLVDVSNKADAHFPADADGYDIDGVAALHYAPAECSIDNTVQMSGDPASDDVPKIAMVAVVDDGLVHASDTTTTTISDICNPPIPDDPEDTHTLISGMKFNDHDGDGDKDENDGGLAEWKIYAAQLAASFEVDSHGDITGTPVDSPILENGVEYLIRVSDTFNAGDSITADAKYSIRTGSEWTDIVENYVGYGPALLDLQLDGTSPNWGSYSPAHIYWYAMTGTGAAVTFQIYDIFASNNVGTLDVSLYRVLDFTLTDGTGNYSFDLLNVEGDVIIAEQNQTGWTQTAPAPVDYYTVPSGGEASNQDFGNYQIPAEPRLGSITGIKFEDHDGDGVKDGSDDQPLAGWTIYLDANDNGSLDSGELSDVTDDAGVFSFPNLSAGTYIVREVYQDGWTKTFPSASAYSLIIGDGEGNDWDWIEIDFGNHEGVVDSQGTTPTGSSGSSSGYYTPAPTPDPDDGDVLGEQTGSNGSGSGASDEAVGGEQTLPVTGTSPWVIPVMLLLALAVLLVESRWSKRTN
ncbi:MAG: PA14 domain-containing protein [Patescibacteria group bacterium]